MKKLDHPNVVKLVEVLDDPEDDQLYMGIYLSINLSSLHLYIFTFTYIFLSNCFSIPFDFFYREYVQGVH